MCGPTAVALGSAAVSMAGQVVQGVGQAQQARLESKAARINAGHASEQGRDAIKRGERDLEDQQRQRAQQRGAMRASMAANGIDPGYGSAADILGDQAQDTADDSRTLVENSYREAMGYRRNHSNLMGQASAAKSRARGAMLATGLNVASTALGAAAQVGAISNAPKGQKWDTLLRTWRN